MPIVVYRLLVLGVTTLVVVAPLSLVIYQSFLTAPFFDPLAKSGCSPIRSSWPILISGRRSGRQLRSQPAWQRSRCRLVLCSRS